MPAPIRIPTAIAACGDVCAEGRCFYCEAPLSPRHEHDHYPLPARHGGREVVPACLNCHDLKDRLPFSAWRSDVLAQGWREMGPVGRIYVAKVMALLLDHRALRADEDAA